MKTFISIVICTYNRCDVLKEMLPSLLDQEQDGTFDFEVIVVDNNSDDATKDIVISFQNRFKGCLKYVLETSRGKPFALNRGIKEANGQILAFTDDDVILDKRWLLSLASCFNNFACDGVGGRVLPVYSSETPQWVKDNPRQMAGAVVIYDYGKEEKRLGGAMDHPIGANYAFKKSVFEDCGAFRTDLSFGRIALGEDTEFIDRIVGKNKVLYYCPGAVVWHPVDLKRLKVSHVARWHIVFGRFAARQEYAAKGKSLVYLFGAPRYLWRGVVQDLLSLMFTIFSRKKSFNSLRGFFRKVGMIQEYREQGYAKKIQITGLKHHA